MSHIELNHDTVCLTNDIAAVICNEGLAVNIDELRDKRLGELGVCSQPAKCDVFGPLVLNWEVKKNHNIDKISYITYSKALT